MFLRFWVLACLGMAILPAHAYIGPGIGAGVIAVVLGILGAFGLGIVGIVFYPIKRFLKNRKQARSQRDSAGR
jgi:hypothetical protein